MLSPTSNTTQSEQLNVEVQFVNLRWRESEFYMKTASVGHTEAQLVKTLQVTYSKQTHQRLLQRRSRFWLGVLIKRLSFRSPTLNVFTKQHRTPISFLQCRTQHRTTCKQVETFIQKAPQVNWRQWSLMLGDVLVAARKSHVLRCRWKEFSCQKNGPSQEESC